MNTLIFTGKLLADAKVISSDKGRFISFTVVETGKGENLPILECTQNIKTDKEPSLVQYLKKFAKVIITGIPYAKIGHNKEKQEMPILACFADRIEIVEFAPTKNNEEKDNAASK